MKQFWVGLSCGIAIAVMTAVFAAVTRQCEDGECTAVTNVTLGWGEDPTLQHQQVSDRCTPSYHTTTGDKNIKASAGELCGFINATGTSVTVTVYDDADGTCNSNQRTGTITLTNGQALDVPIKTSNGICVTVGGTSPTLTVRAR